jgi:hypothetical protein
MSPIVRFLKNLLLRLPQELLVALLRLLLFLILFLIVIILKLWEWLMWLIRTNNLYGDKPARRCGVLPEPIVRRPDPCIYSQQFLSAQGVQVAWDNPDIWMAPASNPTSIEPDSYHLKDDTDYIVTVRAHNASTDAAIGVKVRLVYRPWSFNSPDLVPVETDAGGNEVNRFVDITPMGSTTTTFNWHTPKLGPGEQKHYCLQAHLFHPLDINPANNIGQENADVYSQNPGFVRPGETAELEIPLFNLRRHVQKVRFRWHAYEINKQDKVLLRLKTAHGRPRMSLSDRVAHALPRLAFSAAGTSNTSISKESSGSASKADKLSRLKTFGKLVFGSPKSTLRATKTKYVGFETLRQKILSRDYSIPPNWHITVNLGAEEHVHLDPGAIHTARFKITVPPDVAPGTRLPINIVAESLEGTLIGGVTVLFQVRP